MMRDRVEKYIINQWWVILVGKIWGLKKFEPNIFKNSSVYVSQNLIDSN